MKTARPQLVLLALVAIASLTYYVASVSSTLVEVYADRVPRNPTYHGFHLRAATGVRPEAQDAGVHWGRPDPWRSMADLSPGITYCSMSCASLMPET